jgi:hypothetical protein
MAHVNVQAREHIELLLGHSADRWQRLPEVARDIDSWDLIDQISFIEEWPLEEQRLDMLERYACQGVMTLDQRQRFDDLKRLVARNRPIIERLQRT